MKHILLIFLFTGLTHSTFAGFNDWSYKSDHGTYIADESPGCRISTNHTSKELENVNRWYFYKDHIIGEYDNFIENKPQQEYFILNELNGDIQTYSTMESFNKGVINQELKPLFWTRWYNDHFKITLLLYLLLGIFWLFYWPVVILFFLIVCALLYGCFFTKNKCIKIGCSSFVIFMLTLFILAIINDYYVYSI